MSAGERERGTRTTACSDEPVMRRRKLTVSLGTDPESEAIRKWLDASAGQGDESRRIRQALVLSLQLAPHLERIDTHLAVLTRIEAHMRDAPRSVSATNSINNDPWTHDEKAALAALLDTD